MVLKPGLMAFLTRATGLAALPEFMPVRIFRNPRVQSHILFLLRLRYITINSARKGESREAVQIF
jgi:hypothetical protein